MNKIINGEVVELTTEDQAEIEAEWEANATAQQAQELADNKASQRDLLRQEKLDSMLTVEFAEIDAATTKAAIVAVSLRP